MKKTLYLLLLAAFCSSDAFAQTPIYGSTRAQVEPHIAVNPTDPNNLIVVTITQLTNTPNQIAVYYSYNAGQTWNELANLSGSPSAGDPVIAFDGDGVAYALYQVIDASGLYLRKSTDGGATWTSAVTITLYNPSHNKVDRPWMAISPIRNASGYFDIYVSHTLFDIEFGSNSSSISLLKSTNQGASFSYIHSASSSSGVSQGSSVAVGPDGEVFLAWAGLNASTNAVETISMKRSSNGGGSFSFLNTVTAFQIGQKAGDDYYLKSQQIRADSYPRLAVDRSPGNSRGFAFVTWAGKQSATGNPDILMVRWKKNAGGSFEWSGVESIDQSVGDQWMPAVDVSPDGVVSVLYYFSQTGTSDPIYTYLKNSTNGGVSFSSANNPIGTSTGFTISGTTFLGDYHGLANWFGKAHAIWCENRDHGANDDRQLYFRTITQSELTPANHQYVIIDQVNKDNQSAEKFGRWNQGAFTNYKAPHRFLFQTNANEVLRAKQDFIPATTQKYNKWDADNDVVNHRTFQITSGFIAVKSQFQLANNATLRTEVIDGGSLNIEFRDPWLIDYNDPAYGNNPRNRGQAGALWYSKPSPFSPNTSDPNYKGVFLNQTVEPGKPYYSVRPTNQTVNGLPWFLWDWVTTNATVTQPTSSETPVVFTANNAEVKARVKLHLGSSLSNATAANGQRKLVYANTSPAKFHLVYESAGEIYYTFSTDNGATWSNEILLSSSDGNNKFPSIATHQNKVYVIWQRTTSTNNYTIYVRRYTGSSWASRQTLGSASLTTGNNPLPVITLKEVNVGGVYKIRALAVWKGASALRFRNSDQTQLSNLEEA